MDRFVQLAKSKRLQKALVRKNETAMALIRRGLLVSGDDLIELTKDYWAADDELERLRREERP